MHIQNSEKGQSTIEFLLSLTFAIGITMLFVSQALNMTIGFMVHYATYMGGRTYLSYDTFGVDAGSSISEAGNEAKRAFNRYQLEQFDVTGLELKIHSPSDGTALTAGLTAQYAKLLSPFKLLLDGEKATFYSEGLLGKEPVRATCMKAVCVSVGANGTCSSDMDVTLFDNGC